MPDEYIKKSDVLALIENRMVKDIYSVATLRYISEGIGWMPTINLSVIDEMIEESPMNNELYENDIELLQELKQRLSLTSNLGPIQL